MRFFHSGPMAEIIYSIPAITSIGGGILHIPKPLYNFMEPLLKVQPAIKSVKNHHPKDIHIDLGLFRLRAAYAALKDLNEHIIVSHLKIVGEEFDLGSVWLASSECKRRIPGSAVLISRTDVFPGELNWSALKAIPSEFLTFVGEKRDYITTKRLIGIDELNYVKVNDALELANLIQKSKIVISNQSLAFAIAEGLKHPRILQVCKKGPNYRPLGENGYTTIDPDFIMQIIGAY